MPIKRRTEDARELVRTTVELPGALWRRAKVRAVDERSDLRAVIIAALAMYLKTQTRTQGGRR